MWASAMEIGYVLLDALVDPLPIETRTLPSSRPLQQAREEEIAHMVAEGYSNRQML